MKSMVKFWFAIGGLVLILVAPWIWFIVDSSRAPVAQAIKMNVGALIGFFVLGPVLSILIPWTSKKLIGGKS